MTDQRNPGEFHKADPLWRRRMLQLLAATLAVGVGAQIGLHLWLVGLNEQLSHAEIPGLQRSLHRVLGALVLLLALGCAGLAGWALRLAAATRVERRWPPIHLRTVTDVRIRYLSSAEALAGRLKVGAVLLATLVLGLFGWGAWLAMQD